MKDLAGEQGFEPRYYGPEPHVLPLDDSPIFRPLWPQLEFPTNAFAENGWPFVIGG